MESGEPPGGFVDEPEIPDDELLYRRVKSNWIDWDTLGEDGLPRIKRAAFQDYQAKKAQAWGYPRACMSIGLHSRLPEDREVSEVLLEEWGEEYGLASLLAGQVRERDQGVMSWATPEEPWHGIVFSKIGAKRSQGMESGLAEIARWVVVPNQAT